MDVVQAPGQLGRSERVYGRLLRAYPRPFRVRYESEMVLLFSDQLRDARAASGTGSLATTWFRTLLDLASSALGEHFRKDRSMAQSLTTFEPTRSMRFLGLFGVVGAALLLWAFVAYNPFADQRLNNIRVLLFELAGAAIALAFHRRQSIVAPKLALLTTAGVVIAGLWSAAVMILSDQVDRPAIGTFGLLGLLSAIALWVTPAVWAIGLLHTGAAWQGMPSGLAKFTKVGVVILIGSVVAWFGDDRLGMVDSLWGGLWQAVALAGVVMNGIGWLILGGVLLFGGRATRART